MSQERKSHVWPWVALPIIGVCLNGSTGGGAAPVTTQDREAGAAATNGRGDPLRPDDTEVVNGLPTRHSSGLTMAARGDPPETTGFVPLESSGNTGMDDPEIPKVPEFALKRYAKILQRGEFASNGERLLVARI